MMVIGRTRWAASPIEHFVGSTAAIEFWPTTVAVIGGVFAVSLGPDPVVAKYGEAFVHALAWNIGLLALTFVAAFALPRRQRVVGRGGNQIRARLNN
jgi:hypothetical protein